MRTSIPVLFLCLSALANAASDCLTDAVSSMDLPDMGPAHHPVGRPLPRGREFRQPDGCIEGAWLFDRNGNRRADPGEVRLYGPQRAVACMSCHGEVPDIEAMDSASVFLRQDATTLCLACHNM